MVHPNQPQNMFQVIWATKAWRLFAILLVYMSGITCIIPIMPTLVTNDFASRRAGERVHCEEFGPGTAPPYCQNAHSDVVWWSTWSGFFQNTIVAVLLTPAMGAWSDMHGRKPFLLLAQVLTAVPLTILLLNLIMDLPLYWYYAVQCITGSITSITPSLAYIADVVPPVHRAACFGLIMACFSVAILVGPTVGAQLQPQTAPLVALGTVAVCMVATLTWLPESLSPEAAEQAKERAAASSASTSTSSIGGWPRLQSTRNALNILRRNKLFKRLTIVLMLSSAVMEGLQDLLIQYLQLKLSFGPIDVSHLFMLFGGCALIVQGFLLRSMLSFLGEQRVLVLGLSSYCVQQLALAAAQHKSTALAAVSFGSLGSVTFPTISSIKANNAEEHEQGSVQGALYGARALASGTGPLAFALLFSLFTRTDSTLPFYPGAPFIFGSVVMLGAVVMAARLPVDAGGNCGKLGSSIHSGGEARKAWGDELDDDDAVEQGMLDEEREPLRGRPGSATDSLG